MKQRIQSIDMVRGLIMIVMTLDHTRDFLHLAGPPPLDVQRTTVILFFTRWITHFCAPTFVFLSGVSACLAAQRRTPGQMTAFLLTRGAWLILSDLLIISLIFSFDVQYHFPVLEVLWATGFGMIVLALFIRLPKSFIAVIAILIIAGHNLLDNANLPKDGIAGNLATILLNGVGALIPVGTNRFIFAIYAAIPWTGALLLGYVFGGLYTTGYDAQKRRKVLRLTGCAFISLFIILRLINHYGDPSHWAVQRNAAHTLLSFINASKQTPSLLFMLMTLGPILLLLSYTEGISNRVTRFCVVYGNVPYFYFISHLALLRVINVTGVVLAGIPLNFKESSPVWAAPGFGIPLWAVYLSWMGVIALMYLPCRWYGRYKLTHSQWWLSYI
ncbi:DUF1624 domain-containing protein [Inquilinus sp. KBS0705]|nr:DUF1624 domain-containing protein [Inquilinus sp. KBS0705]